MELEVGKVTKRGEVFFFFVLFCFLFFCFFVFLFLFLFFFLLLFTFENDGKFVLGLPKSEFSTGKKHFTSGKKSGKITLPLQKNLHVTPLFVMGRKLTTLPLLST